MAARELRTRGADGLKRKLRLRRPSVRSASDRRKPHASGPKRMPTSRWRRASSASTARHRARAGSAGDPGAVSRQADRLEQAAERARGRAGEGGRGKAARESALTIASVDSAADAQACRGSCRRARRVSAKRAEQLAGTHGVGCRARSQRRSSLDAARRTVTDGEQAKRMTGSRIRPRRLKRRSVPRCSGALPAAAGRPGESATTPGWRASGIRRREFEALEPASRRAARLEIDRELALRKELSVAARDVAAAGARRSPAPRATQGGQGVRSHARAASARGRPQVARSSGRNAPGSRSSRHGSADRAQRIVRDAARGSPARDVTTTRARSAADGETPAGSGAPT